ncbi:universal stress protein [Galbitalea sp. SE-J8]|uniref:universal stress protein n=1 Tax=Galbitalea sp. SE-J8 TaxID=3054952 RepID=UPI00259C6D26|nr:universal stress protein [Galbitalea sp. SE-J8]MDM4763669.1 universal stress protein [Galbitalea sp. SE-J8]
MSASTAHVVVGVVPGQPDAVIETAATFAERFHADLVCAWVDVGRYAIGTGLDGAVVSLSIDPDLADGMPEVFDPALRESIAATLDKRGVAWSTRALAGSPASELARLADELDAALIVVGTREPGVMGSMREFFAGSVAVQLAHRQHRPIVVVPLSPVGIDDRLPWDQTA